MVKPLLCQRIVCRQTCQAPMTMIVPGRRSNKWMVLKVLERAVSDSEVEKWNFYLQAAKHFDEVDQDVASYEASHPTWISRAKLGWSKTKTGRRRARRVGSGGARYSLPTVEDEKPEKACDAF
eukprot:1818770-Amphidinium_carterae.1